MPLPFGSDKIDAISIWGPGEHPVVFLNSTFPVDRRRRTLAHELGHLVLHATDVSDDPEKEADTFASELLMPAAEIRHELRDLRIAQLPDLKRRWKLSMRSFVYWAQQLGEITKDQARYMYMRLNQLYGSKREPIELSEETPTLMDELIGRHLTELAYSQDQLVAVARSNIEPFERYHGPGQRRLYAL